VKLAIYIEGGGNTADQKAILRQGFEGLFREIRERARAKNLGPKLVLCGNRQDAFEAFRNACQYEPSDINILLVDSEGPVDRSASTFLKSRDTWDLVFANENQIHLMVQLMETWLLADEEALAKHYGQHFASNALPKGLDLEGVPKNTVESSLNKATARTSKGQYHKIRHASALLAAVDPKKVRDRCRHCERLFTVALQLIDKA
jgi:hypothetical protein